MDGRKRLSGAKYRKVAGEKKNKVNEIISKTVKLDYFFKSNPSTGETSSQSDSTPSQSSRVDEESYGVETREARVNDQPSLVSLSTEPSGGPNKVASNAEENEDVLLKPDTPTTSITGNLKPSNDPVLWKINDTTRDYFVKNGFNQNKDGDFEQSKRVYPDKNRFLNKALFDRKLAGDLVNRGYLVYSPSQGSLFCGPCKLFCLTSSQFSDSGFSDWKHGYQRVKEHENSHAHLDSVLTYKRRAAEMGKIDNQLQTQIEEEVKYWRAVLQRVVAVIKKLASRGLAFRGEDELVGSTNNGNYMMCLELIAEFDPFLKAHIDRHGNPGQGKSSYLSSTICDELIEIMGRSVTESILKEVKTSKYFSIIVDSTPDVTHNDQLSFILRYVNEYGYPEERFVEFFKNQGHTGKELVDSVFEFFKGHGLDIQNCRGQSFDNASNMSGIYSGLQARLKEANPLIFYVPCSAHSLNLVGSSAAECCNLSRSFFDLVQGLYNFFSSSTHRWNVLESFFKPGDKNLTIKSLSITRWSAREEACKSLNRDFEAIAKALKFISMTNSQDENEKTKNKAKGLLRRLVCTETSFMAALCSQ